VLVLRIRKSEVAGWRGQRSSVRAGHAEHAIAPQTGRSQLAPVRAAAAGVTLSRYGRPMSPRTPF